MHGQTEQVFPAEWEDGPVLCIHREDIHQVVLAWILPAALYCTEAACHTIVGVGLCSPSDSTDANGLKPRTLTASICR